MTSGIQAWISVVLPGHGDRPMEDDVCVRPADGVFAAVDGVTRDRLADGTYPDPSPAQLAAEAVARAICESPGTASAYARLARANSAVAVVNEGLGLHRSADFLDKDRAGAVASVAEVRNHEMSWAYVGDAGAAVLDGRGEIRHQTADDVAFARNRFPSRDIAVRTRKIRIRRDLRNRAPAERGGYGVLTGEDAVERYIQSGVWTMNEGDVGVVFTDGFRPLLRDQECREQLLRALYVANIDLSAFVSERRRALRVTDDIAVVAWRRA